MESGNSKYLELDIPTVMPMFNSEEKVDELNRLLDILAKRKKYSIIVSMLLVFQQHNYQKLLKDFLTDGVKEIIIKYPLRVVSYHGVPFTVQNFFRGMRVEYSKHKLFQREMVEGNEYVYVNLVYTCIFLSDEIAKICKGSKNLKLKTIHRSLIDEIDANPNPNPNADPYDTSDNNVSSKYINEQKNLDNTEEIKNQIENNQFGTRITRRQKNNLLNGAGGVISLDDSEEEKERESNNNNEEKNSKKTNDVQKYTNNEESLTSNDKENTKKNNEEKIVKGSVKYQDDLNYLKSTMQDILNIFDYSYSSPLSTFLNNNVDNITQLGDTFKSMQNIGENGEKFIDNLIKLIPESMHEEINSSIENEENKIRKDEKFQEKSARLDKLYCEYEKTKNLIIYYYSIIQSTVKNIRHSGMNFNEMMIKKDLEYLNINEKKYDKKVNEIFPLLNKIYNYFTQEYPMKNVVENLQSESNELGKYDINIRVFNNFLQGISSLFPSEDGHEHNCLDLIVKKNVSYEEKEQQFKKKLLDERNLLVKYIEPLRKHFSDKKDKDS